MPIDLNGANLSSMTSNFIKIVQLINWSRQASKVMRDLNANT